jgi:hypothetical protein
MNKRQSRTGRLGAAFLCGLLCISLSSSSLAAEKQIEVEATLQEGTFDGRSGMFAACEFYLSSGPFWEQFFSKGWPTCEEIRRPIEEIGGFSRYNLQSLTLFSGMGLHLSWSPKAMNDFARLKEEIIGRKWRKVQDFLNHRFLQFGRVISGFKFDPARAPYPVFAEFSAGDPSLLRKFNPEDPLSWRWNPEAMKKTFSPGVWGQALRAQALWADALLRVKREEEIGGYRRTLYGATPKDGFEGLMFLYQAECKLWALGEIFSFDGAEFGPAPLEGYDPYSKPRYYPHEIRVNLKKPKEKNQPLEPCGYEASDPESDLFDQASLLQGLLTFYRISNPKVEGGCGELFGKKRFVGISEEYFSLDSHRLARDLAGVVFNNLKAMHFDPDQKCFASRATKEKRGKRVRTRDAGLLLLALESLYRAFPEETALRGDAKNFIHHQAGFLLARQETDGSFRGAYPLSGKASGGTEKTLADQGLAIMGLLAAHKVCEEEKYLHGAMRTMRYLEKERWVPKPGLYLGGEKTQESIIEPMDYAAVLGALRRLAEKTGDIRFLRRTVKFIRGMKAAGIQRAELGATGEDESLARDSDKDGVPKVRFAGGKYGTAPVFAGRIKIVVR